MNTLIISIGSNINSTENIERCREALAIIFPTVLFSSTSITKPFGKQYKNNFLNQLALATTANNLEETNKLLKSLEKEMGRKNGDKDKGIVVIDIDIVKWNDTILKTEDWQRSYVADLLPSLYQHLTE